MTLTARRGALGPLCSPGRLYREVPQEIREADALFAKLILMGKSPTVALAEVDRVYPNLPKMRPARYR